MKGSLHKIFFYTFLLSVYGAFFSVESFFNFELSIGGHPQAQEIVQKQKPHPSSSTHVMRLNKRYHQEEIAPCPIFSPAVPERYITLVRLGVYRTGALPFVAIIHYSLRGPPTVA